MEVEDRKCYGKAPWIFKGSALYQFHLVKAEIARAIIPKELRLVEAFGYTLGGFFLANYDDSPVGRLDELVVIAGIVWNPPTSHAWAARVYVNSDEACRHGRKEFGLPSHVATFSKSIKAMSRRSTSEGNGFLTTDNNMDTQVAEIDGPMAVGFFDIRLTSPVVKMNPNPNPSEWMGMGIKLSLSSFSGHTEHKPQLLKYSCQIECRVRPTSSARVVMLMDSEAESSNKKGDVATSVLLSKPILALEFNCLRMQVQPPVVVSQKH